MKKIVCLLIIIVTCLTYVHGQSKTFLEVGAGPVYDLNRSLDPSDIFTNSYLFGTTQGIGIWQELMKNLYVGTGLYYHLYSSGINMKDDRPHQAIEKSFKALLFPLRISYRIKFSDYPISITPVMGYQFGRIIGKEFTYNKASSMVNPKGLEIAYNYFETLPSASNLNLLEAGVTFDYRLENNWQLSIVIAQLSGFNEVKSSLINYEINNTGKQAVYTSDGSCLQTMLSLYIPVSNLWVNKDYRLRRHIENSIGRGSGVRKRNYIYFGGNVGALWRAFSANDPAVGPWPFSAKRILNYANLHTGVYAGYLHNKIFAVDLGAYYQASSTYFALMYNHETDYTTKVKAPMFLEFPLMFRYNYELFDNKLFLVPGIGFSILTHFSGNDFAAGTGTFEYQSNTENFSYDADRNTRFGYCIKAEMGLDYSLPIRLGLLATLNISYNYGLSPIEQINIETSITGSPEISNIYYTGRGCIASLGLKLPIVLGKDNRKCGALPMRR